MKTISGLVRVQETQAGVPQLLVEAYDARQFADEWSNFQPTARAFRQLRRLGSVLTDADGKFVLTTLDLEFEGNDSRPNLVLAIYAPEDVRDDVPRPDTPEDRLLYVSASPRFEAGAEEAFDIRLRRVQLTKLRIPVAGGAVRAADVNRAAGAIENAWDLRDAMKARLAPRLQKEHAAEQTRREAGRKHVAALSAIPRYLRTPEKGEALQNNTFLINGKNELAKNLDKLQRSAVSDGIKRLDTSTNKPTVRLHLTNDQLKAIGLTADAKLTGTVDPKALAVTIRTISGGVDLIRVRGIENPSADALEKRYLSKPQSAKSNPS
jgi:hypothetical protein